MRQGAKKASKATGPDNNQDKADTMTLSETETDTDTMDRHTRRDRPTDMWTDIQANRQGQ